MRNKWPGFGALIMGWVMICLLSGCSGLASFVSSPQDKDPVQSKLSASVVLTDATPKQGKRVFIQSNGIEESSVLVKSFRAAFAERGMLLAHMPEQAEYLVQLNQITNGPLSKSMAENLLHDGYGAAPPTNLQQPEVPFRAQIRQEEQAKTWQDRLQPWKWDWDWLTQFVDKRKHTTFGQVVDIQVSEKLIVDPNAVDTKTSKHVMVFPRQWRRYQTRMVNILPQDYADKKNADVFLSRALVRRVTEWFEGK